MTTGRLGVALVMNQSGTLKGIFTDGDFRRALVNKGVSMSECVDAYITERPLTVNADVRLVDAEKLMRTNKVRCLEVTDADASTPIGIVELFDF